MPSDNLENLFREKVEEVQHTPPPQFSWTPEKSWEQLQPLLPAPRRRSTPNFYLGVAAGLVLALLAGLSLHRMSEPRTPATAAVASTGKLPVSQRAEAFNTPERSPEKLGMSVADAVSAGASRAEKTERPFVARKRVIPAPILQEKETLDLSAQKKEQESAGEPASVAAVAAASADSQPLKITVVLGARTLARAEALAQETTAIADPNLLAKEKPRKKKLRLRIHPDTSPQTDSQLATIKPVSSDLGLGTRIKF